ncbi:hypothetical protein WDU94_014303 [Cyamophila willieti]
MSNSIRQINKLFVGNLPWSVSHNELKKYFSEFGQIAQAIVMFDKNTGMSRGYGFVTFLNKEATDKVFNIESHILEGGRLNVQPSDSVYNNRSRHVVLPKELAKLVPKTHLMSEEQWRAIGVQMSPGWIHYMHHSPEPHILLFRRPIQGQPPN